LIQAVWSFWTKPFRRFHHSAWLNERDHALSWILSVGTVQRHYSDTFLITDDSGAETLIEKLGLRFGKVSLELNALDGADEHWWVLGKLYAYRAPQRPFVHVDSDVFLWKRLPKWLVNSRVFAQNPERFIVDGPIYRPTAWEAEMQRVGATLPREWQWYSRRRGNVAACCGIVGGRDYEFLRYYAQSAITMLEEHGADCNLSTTERLGCNVLIEQYFLSSCIEYHRWNPESRFFGIDIRYLFEPDADVPTSSRQRGYTHLMGSAKRDSDIAERLERRVQKEFPDAYRRLNSLFPATRRDNGSTDKE
jgi:hypothetical protein